jgi:hypothetical protein
MVNHLVYHLSFYFGIVGFLYTKIMSKEKYNQIFDDAYKNYCEESQTKIIKTTIGETHISPSSHYKFKSKEEFMVLVRANEEFAKTWGLVFESRNLTNEELHEREPKLKEIYDKKVEVVRRQAYQEAADLRYEEKKILETLPSRVITLTYKDETIEVYE